MQETGQEWGAAPATEPGIARGPLEDVARWMAYAGGILLTVLAGITVISVLGRKLSGLGLQPVPGDYELVKEGCALAIFFFLPWCTLRRGHVTVDVLVDRLPARLRGVFTLLGQGLLAAVASVVLWRLYLGFAEKFPYFGPELREALAMGRAPFFPETTYELQLPVWALYGVSVIGAAVFCLTAWVMVWRAGRDLLAGDRR